MVSAPLPRETNSDPSRARAERSHVQISCWGRWAPNHEPLSKCYIYVAVLTECPHPKATFHDHTTCVRCLSEHSTPQSQSASGYKLSRNNLGKHNKQINKTALEFEDDIRMRAVQEAGRKALFNLMLDCYEQPKQDFPNWVESQNFMFKERAIFKDLQDVADLEFVARSFEVGLSDTTIM